ncbi:unnamed protein product [Hydatigera taeniaeformis]|uniref:KRAB domain-containing protein n=1 Tax=Hydatigena taeniaeformis TaxID=6205 RepID=A0A0R3WU38_HYDTA|nr:unnamed protein product [Hydatigera taeniaeformis]
MEERKYGNGFGSNLEETMFLTEEHRKFAQVVALQEEKCQRLANFQITQLEESDPEWEAVMEQQMMENLKRLNILVKIPGMSEVASSGTVPLQEGLKPFESAPFGERNSPFIFAVSLSFPLAKHK